MKGIKKILALALVIATVLCLSGCGSFEMQLLKGAKNMAKLENLHMDADVELVYTVNVGSKALDMEGEGSFSADIQTEPLTMKGKSGFSIFGLGGGVYTYAQLMGESLTIGLSLDGEHWKAETTEGFVIPEDLPRMIAMGAVKYISDFEKAEESELVGNREAIRYNGALSGADIKEILSVTGLDAQLQETTEGEFRPEMIGDEISVPMSLLLCKKTGMLLRTDIDFRELADTLTREDIAEAVGLPGDINFTGGIKKALISIKLSAFDELGSISSPIE